MEEQKNSKSGQKAPNSTHKYLGVNPNKPSTKAKPKFNKNLVYAACGIIAILSVALITWSIIKAFNKNINEDTTFATNDNQATITVEPTDDNSGSGISHTRTVYEFDGDNVVGMKTYFEYSDNDAAKAAYEVIKDQPEFKGAEVIDKYIVVTADPSRFKGLTVDDIRQQSENLKRYYESQKKTEPAEQAPADQPADQPEDQSEPEPEPSDSSES